MGASLLMGTSLCWNLCGRVKADIRQHSGFSNAAKTRVSWGIFSPLSPRENGAVSALKHCGVTRLEPEGRTCIRPLGNLPGRLVVVCTSPLSCPGHCVQWQALWSLQGRHTEFFVTREEEPLHPGPEASKNGKGRRQ